MNVSERAEVVEKIIEGAGGLASLVAKCGVTRQAVDKWRRVGVPPKRVRFVETISGVPRYVQRPDIYPPEESLLTTRRRRVS